jgi:hypothetical protein
VRQRSPRMRPSPAWIVADREAVTLALVPRVAPARLVRPGQRGCGCPPKMSPRAQLHRAHHRRARHCTASFADELFAIRPSPQDPAPATARTILEAHGGP